ncbi:MAG: hypothetical protein CW338_00545 [Clostridiales bacterium]|nr:hypothetical protein [Clostridiales bacterium]
MRSTKAYVLFLLLLVCVFGLCACVGVDDTSKQSFATPVGSVPTVNANVTAVPNPVVTAAPDKVQSLVNTTWKLGLSDYAALTGEPLTGGLSGEVQYGFYADGTYMALINITAPQARQNAVYGSYTLSDTDITIEKLGTFPYATQSGYLFLYAGNSWVTLSPIN